MSRDVYTSRGTVITPKAVIRDGTFDIHEIISDNSKIKDQIIDICRYKGIDSSDYINKIQEVAENLSGHLKDTEAKIRREVQSIFPLTGDRSDPEIVGSCFFGDVRVEYIVSHWEEKAINYITPQVPQQEGEVQNTSSDPSVNGQVNWEEIAK